MAEDPQPLTLQQRIAALNASHVNRTPNESPLTQGKLYPHTKRPAVLPRQRTINNPPEHEKAPGAKPVIGNLANGADTETLPPPKVVRPVTDTNRSKPPPPPLPKRQSSQQLPEQCPALPPRRPIEHVLRQPSSGSNTSLISSFSGNSNDLAKSKSQEFITNTAPARRNAQLPPLPSRADDLSDRRSSVEKLKYNNRVPPPPFQNTIAKENSGKEQAEPPRRSLPPRLPVRGQTEDSTDGPSHNDRSQQPLPVSSVGSSDHVKRPTQSPMPSRREPPPLPAGRPANHAPDTQQVDTKRQPPAVPLASRPSLAAIANPKTDSLLAMRTAYSVPSSGQLSSSSCCMVCRDFSAPDYHATLFPRQSVQSLQNLGQQLTSPFPSSTDKARAIFTWLHHNIAYDTEAFFAGNVQPSTPQSTLRTGLGVCEGYAALFTTIATHGGLESIVISGHGKGYGFNSLPAGSPAPSYSSSHAWNAVRIDNGEWKLIDPCWGAGHVQGPGKPFVQNFKPRHFTMSNEEFGTSHFPGNKDMFFLPDGRRLAWEDYIRINPKCWPNVGSNAVEPPVVFSDATPEYGIGDRTVCPRTRFLRPASGGTLRFSFELECPHWDLQLNTRKGPPPVFILAIHGVDGREKDYLPLDYLPGNDGGGGSSSRGGDKWQVDIDAERLGAPGQTVTICAVTSFGPRKDSRGMSVEEFRQGKGRLGMAFKGAAAWELI